MSYKSTFSAVLISLTLMVGSYASASSVHGVLQVVKGDVQIKSAKDGKTAKAKVGSKIFPKDSIITGKDSRAKIVMVDNNVINVSPDTNLEIQNYEYAPEQGKKDVLLNVLYGKVRSKVEQKYDGKGAKFQVKTPTAVAGVRGTDFMASFSQENRASSIVTFEGKVEFGQQGPGGSIVNPVFVSPGQMTEMVGNTQAPPPQPVPPGELANMDQDSKAEGNPRAPAGKDDKQDGPDKNKGSGNDKDKGSKDSAANRQGGGSGGPRGLASGGSGGGFPPPPVAGDDRDPVIPEMHTDPGPLILPPPVPTCSQCNEAISSGNTNLIIKITNGGP